MPGSQVQLAEVSEEIVRQLLELAITDASPDEVTPPLGTAAGWNAERIEWFYGYHRAAAAGLDGEAQEKSWAIVSHGTVAGSVRLKRTGPGSMETGIWLGRTYRGCGIGRNAMQLLIAEASLANAGVLEASTTPGNAAALGLLRDPGATLTWTPRAVTASLDLGQHG